MKPGRIALAVLFAVGFGLVGFTPARPADDKPVAPAGPVAEVEKHLNIAYRDDTAADKERHKLDVYVPKGRKDFPVILFVHGGSWKSGNKNLYPAVGLAFAKLGYGVVVTNYRLSPEVRHPAHIEDVAGAFAWAHANIGKYGGRNDRLFVFGHSAGGHLVSLLATDPAYLKVHKLSPADVRGVIGVSGVYKLYPDFPLFQTVFGKDEEVCKRASPLTHVSGKHPPFLLAYADNDYRELDKMAVEMHAALEKADCPTTLLKCTGRNHITIITQVIDADDALHKAVTAFLAKHAK